MTTARAPYFASATAIARPMPEAAPVITATVPPTFTLWPPESFLSRLRLCRVHSLGAHDQAIVVMAG